MEAWSGTALAAALAEPGCPRPNHGIEHGGGEYQHGNAYGCGHLRGHGEGQQAANAEIHCVLHQQPAPCKPGPAGFRAKGEASMAEVARQGGSQKGQGIGEPYRHCQAQGQQHPCVNCCGHHANQAVEADAGADGAQSHGWPPFGQNRSGLKTVVATVTVAGECSLQHSS